MESKTPEGSDPKQAEDATAPQEPAINAEQRPSSGTVDGIRKSVATLDPQSQARADMMAELEKKVGEAFEIFDHAANKTVDVREVGTILRSLGCVPTEAEIQEIIVSVEDQESPGSVHLDRFQGHVVNIISEYKMQPASAEELLKAFQTLDLEGTGYITKDVMAVLMKEGSEPFTDEELEEMMGAAIEPGTDHINYELYINQIMADESLMRVLEDTEPPLNAPLAAKYKKSFAFPSMNDRVPVIITKIIDYLVRDKKNLVQNYGESAEDELKAVIGEISQLKNHLQTAKCFQEFTSDAPDSEFWNSELKRRKAKGDPLNYYQSDWLLAECYLYRRLREIFATKNSLNKLDPFSYQKDDVLEQSIDDLGPHLKRLYDDLIFDNSRRPSTLNQQILLAYMIKYALWANRMDLSLSGGNTDVGINVIDQVKNWDGNILVDDTNQVVSLIIGNSLEAVDIVTDNGGIELLNDLILADFLVTVCGVKRVRFRVKPMPWYVSDVTPQDFLATIDSVACRETEHYKFFAGRWRTFVDQGTWEVTAENYWCLGLSYSEMPRVDPNLYSALKASPLVIFKGDLNYRKLVQDRNWETTKSFREALGNFADVKLLALRTCKADTICGLGTGVAEDVSSRSPNWLVSGEYGLIQFNTGC